MFRHNAPLEIYAQRLKTECLQRAQQTLEAFIQQTHLDITANRKTIHQLKSTQKQLKSAHRINRLLKILNILLWACGLFCLFLIIGILWRNNLGKPLPQATTLLALSGTLMPLAALLVLLLRPALKNAQQRVTHLTLRAHQLNQTAWEQMAPLNACFTWSTITDLLRQLLPTIHFDHMLSQARIDDLVENLNWQNNTLRDTSIHHLQSGEIQGNPFIILEGRKTKMGEKTYTGTKIVRVKHQTYINGRPRTTYSTELLTASITCPYPEYYPVTLLLFGSDTTPNLNFSRAPSKYAGMKNTLFNRFAKRRAEKKLEKFSRNLDDQYGFTMMANREFETLFCAKDRTDEQAFRRLFTPLAQQQIVQLLNDTTTSYGDNFHMTKKGAITFLFPKHLETTNLSLDPQQFASNDIDALAHHFLTHTQNYFKAIYFALSPIHSIPANTSERTPPRQPKSAQRQPSTYENELLANTLGEDHFKPANCVTPCILKAHKTSTGEPSTFTITAHGYRSQPRTHYATRFDSNGRLHQVPIHWNEYLPVKKTTHLAALPDTTPEGLHRTHQEALTLLRTHTLHHIRTTYLTKTH